MPNYSNLNDMEFEALCQDVMSRRLGVQLRRFAAGRDGGVDLTDDAAQHNIVVQVKHYMKTSTSGLIRTLKTELPKVNALKPKQYFICCSKELSDPSIKGLYQHFAAYMDSSWNIVTLTEIDDFLKKPENRDILEKHFKLWLDDTGILQQLCNDDIFVDCEVLLADVEARQHRFVRTRIFDQALEILDKGQTLCIIGDPGVGKSITSQMLVLHYAALGYRVRYTTDVTDLTSLKKSLQRDKNAKEVILLDDCFGQAYFEMKSSQSTELVQLIRYVRLHPNKLLILNSRITIFQEARARQRVLNESLEQKEFQIRTLDLNQMSSVEKAKILYNHLAFSGIPKAYFRNLQKDRRYRRIVHHPNYNPRIIEYVCNPIRYETVKPNLFFKFVCRHLDNPQQIWADEYDDRLQPVDRILLQTIYSMTKNTVSADLVHRCFVRRLAELPGIDQTVDQYSRSLKRLNDNFVRQLDNDSTLVLSMLNPSVNDFLDNRLQIGTGEHGALMRSICCEKQIQRLLPWNEQLPFAVELLKSGRIDSFIFEEPHHRTRFIARCILASGLCMAQYQKDLNTFLGTVIEPFYWYGMDQDERADIIKRLCVPSFWEYYQLKTYFLKNNYLLNYLCHFDLEGMVLAVRSMDPYFQNDDEAVFFVSQAEDALRKGISSFCLVDAADYDTYCDYLSEESVSSMVSAFEDCIWEQVTDDLVDALEGLPKHFQHLEADQFFSEVDIYGAEEIVKSYLEDLDYDDSFHKDDDIHSEMDPVDAIFLR